MFRNYLKVFFRNTSKNPFYSAINILGLAIGLACSIVAFLYINNELSYNKQFNNYDKIYRIGAGIERETRRDSFPFTLYDVAPAITEQIPEVEAAARFVTWYSNSLIKFNDDFFPNTNVIISDSSMIDVFSFKVIKGDKSNFLKSPHQIAITKSLANKIFKGQNPLHQMIEFEGKKLEVAWIMADPKNSIIDFDMVVNFNYTEELLDWLMFDCHTFFRASRVLTNIEISKVKAVSNQVILSKLNGMINKASADVQLFKDIYLRSDLGSEIGPIGSLRTIYIFSFLASIILSIAVINYINLLTSRSEYRNKEVGIRKVVGAKKKNIQIQFLSESILLSILALFLSFVVTEFFTYLVNGRLLMNLSLFRQSSIPIVIMYFVVALIVGVISGIYPSFIMAGFNPLKVIKGVFETHGNSNFLKVVLVIVQFSLSTLLIITIFIFNSQINYLKNKDLGFDHKDLIVLPKCTETIQKNYSNIRQELISYHNIKNVGASQTYPGRHGSGQSIRKLTEDPKTAQQISENRVQDYYVETMGIEIIKGRSFNPNFDDTRSILLNETAAKMLNVEDPIGLEVMTNRESVIIGVFKDYHYLSTTREIEGLYLSNYADWFYNMEIRIAPEDKLGTMMYIKKIIMNYDPDYYWNYFFLDDILKNQYKSEERLFTMIFWGSALAIILSILGLFALTSYTVSKRFKEIGIRKTFGASVNSIVRKLNRDIVKWVLLTNIIAWPLAYFIMKDWLQNYPYRVDINWVYFIIASAISLLIAIATISIQAIKAARMNPVDAIRYE